MTRKHFRALAAMLASHGTVPTPREWEDDDPEAWQSGYEAARQDIGRSIAAVCRLDNPNFDAGRFFDAAKLTVAA